MDEHEIRIQMLDNSHIFVTCACMISAANTFKHPNKSKKKKNRTGVKLPDEAENWKSLGDFPVGTPTPLMIEAYNKHLEE